MLNVGWAILESDAKVEIFMGHLREEFDEGSTFSEFSVKEDPATLSHRKRVRKMLEDRLEKKRLKEEIDELDGEFDWDELNR